MHFIAGMLCIILSCGEEAVVRAKAVQDIEEMVGYANLARPDALQPEDVARWARTLQASAAQLAFMQAQYVIFAERQNEFMRSEGVRYLEQSTALLQQNNARGPRTTHESADAYIEFRAVTDGFRSRLQQLENAYIDSLIPELSMGQQDKLYILRNEASRRQSRSEHCRVRWGTVDLRLAWEVVWSEDISEADAKAMEEQLAEYETRITPVLERASKVVEAGGNRLVRMLAQEAAGEFDSTLAMQRHDAIWEKMGSAFQRVREVTQEHLVLMEQSLSPATAKRFVAEAKAAAFPECYPDATDYTGLFERLVADASIDEKLRREVSDMQAGYVAEYKAACESLEFFCIDFGDKSARGQSPFQPYLLPQEIKPLIAIRTAVSEKWLALVSEIVLKDVVTAHMPEPPSMERTEQQIRITNAGDMRRPKPPRRPTATPSRPHPSPTSD